MLQKYDFLIESCEYEYEKSTKPAHRSCYSTIFNNSFTLFNASAEVISMFFFDDLNSLVDDLTGISEKTTRKLPGINKKVILSH